MDWKEFTKRFRLKAQESHMHDFFVEKSLRYAKNLFDKSVPIIFDQKHLSQLVGYQYDFLLKVSNASNRFYSYYKIKKKKNGYRIIAEPFYFLKEIQKWILIEILQSCEVSEHAKGYLKNCSTINNAKMHIGAKKLLSLDIKDFFPSINSYMVFQFFSNLGYEKGVSMLLTSLCCCCGALPQGAPTSPFLSNLVFRKLDNSIAEEMVAFNVSYSRYSDDMSFSGDFDAGKIISVVRRILKNEHFEIHPDKIKFAGKNKRQLVTGIVINEKLQATRTLRMKLRQEVYYIRKYGLTSHMQKVEINQANYLRHLLGIANYICFINPEDKNSFASKEFLKSLLFSSKTNASHIE